MNPIIRWSIGPVSSAGMNCLRMSVESARKLFPNFDFFVFYNQIDPSRLEILKPFNVQILKSEDFLNTFFLQPLNGYHVHWKLFPPRIQQGTYEIFLDNDVILTKIPKEIESFLSYQNPLVCQGIRFGAHGQFYDIVPKGVRINSGIFGLPPNFEFAERAQLLCKRKNITGWKKKFDEQGLVAATLILSGNCEIISNVTIPILEPDFSLPDLTTRECCGYHFVNLNRSTEHEPWREFLNRRFLI